MVFYRTPASLPGISSSAGSTGPTRCTHRYTTEWPPTTPLRPLPEALLSTSSQSLPKRLPLPNVRESQVQRDPRIPTVGGRPQGALDLSFQNGLEALNTVEDAGMEDQEPFDFTKEWTTENAIDHTSFDSLELELARLSSPAYTIPFGLPYDAHSFSSDSKSPSLIGISFSSAESPSSRNIDQRGGPPFVVAPAVGLETPGSASFVNLGLPSTSPVDQDWEKQFKMWAQGLRGGGMATPDSSSFGADSTLPPSFVVGDGGSRKRDRSEMEREYQASYEEANEQYFEPEPTTISTSNLIVEGFTPPPPPPLPFRPYLKLVSPGKRKERQFRLGYDEDAVRMLREAQMTVMIQLATDAPITPSIFPLSDLLLPLLDSNNPNVKARTILYYNLIGRSPPASSPSSFPLGLEPAFVHNDDDEQEADPRALDLAWYKKEWLALGYTENALRHFGWVEEEE
ncbi:hypothetical protein BDY24DRAFT_411281 [Mrakia frigida]|uniref:uncharacterized protein n=1 Tax=Mrakia frigida TaxID=29902 RepID=UPI003FCC0CD8